MAEPSAELVRRWEDAIEDLFDAGDRQKILDWFLENYERKRVVFVGAGFTLNASNPHAVPIPLWSEIVGFLAQELGISPQTDPLIVADLYQDREQDLSAIRQLLDDSKLEPSGCYRSLWDSAPEAIVTTNFLDTVLERDARLLPIVRDPDLGAKLSADQFQLIYLHGHRNHVDTWVVGRSSYEDLGKNREQMLVRVRQLFGQHPAIIVGYSLNDPDFHPFYRRIAQAMQFRQPKGLVIFVTQDPNDPLTKLVRDHWHRLGLHIACFRNDSEGSLQEKFARFFQLNGQGGAVAGQPSGPSGIGPDRTWQFQNALVAPSNAQTYSPGDPGYDEEVRTETSVLTARLLESLSSELLHWPQTVNDSWLERSELETVRQLLDGKESDPLVLLGSPGVGKSALLAHLGNTLKADGWNVVAIKADQLPATIATLKDLAAYVGLEQPFATALEELSKSGRTVLIVDQLDALSRLSDLSTERLSVLLSLISSASRLENVRVVCSARRFDFEHDLRFQRIAGNEVQLDPLSPEQVGPVLAEFDVAFSELSAGTQALLCLPQWLKFVANHLGHVKLTPTETEQTLLEKIWALLVCSPPEDAGSNEQVVTEVAAEISRREELWVPLAVLQGSVRARQTLLTKGVLAETGHGSRIGFSHQLLYEFARARDLLSKGTLLSYIQAKQNSLFVRPAVWTTLKYLRGAAPGQYAQTVAELFNSDLRVHLRLLVIDFLGQQEEPTDVEVALLSPLLSEERWGAAVVKAISKSRGWFARTARHSLRDLMLSDRYHLAYPILAANISAGRDQVLTVMQEYWGGKADRAGIILNVLSRLDDWPIEARDMANDALAHTSEETNAVELVIWQLTKKTPEHGIYLAVRSLTRQFERVRNSLSYSPPPADDASVSDRVTWYANREPLRTIKDLVRGASHVSVLIDLAQAAPGVFLRDILPWVSAVLDVVAETDEWHPGYRKDQVIDCSQRFEMVRELPHALRAAAEGFASANPAEFLALLSKWEHSDLATIHVIFSYGLEIVAKTHPQDAAAYLLADPRRLKLGEIWDEDARTLAIIRAIGSTMTQEEAGRLKAMIAVAQISSEDSARPVSARNAARNINRRHRFELLAALAPKHLSEQELSHVEQERRYFGEEGSYKKAEFYGGLIGSPMSSKQMEKASDDDIANLFEVLPDTTGWDHPERRMEGGAVQASQEFGKFAKDEPQRALSIVRRLTAGKQEKPAGYAVRALADSEFATEDLVALIVELDQKGFSSDEFRWDAAHALEKRASDDKHLPEEAIQLLFAWLGAQPDAVRSTQRTPPKDDRGSPPFLVGWSGGGILPAGNYPYLDALTIALLVGEHPRAKEWLSMLMAHVARDEDPEVWVALLRPLKWLNLCDAPAAGRFLEILFDRYPECLECVEGVLLLADVSWWADHGQMQSWTTTLSKSEWKHSAYAYGELVAFFGARKAQMPWAQEALAELLGRHEVQPATVGAANTLAQLWLKSDTRAVLTPILCKLVLRCDDDIDRAVIRTMRSDELVGDDSSKRILACFARRDQGISRNEVNAAVEWATKLVDGAAEDVLVFCNRVLDTVTAEDSGAHLIGASEDLIKIAMTLQRVPGLQDQGLTLFERLLEMDLYRVKETLDDIQDLQKWTG